ncbi:MAG: hypothetical protein KatS3mg094_178 [Candidatus Parcubacteria bacterium]|nr:MAG: hypothetical protein KatS3mg094_178 [Candidatus Parcubacteria bacterium]
MKNYKNNSIIYFLLVSIFYLLATNLLATNFVFALTVGPAKLEFITDPGQTLEFSLFVRNDSDYDNKYQIIVEGFTEEGGERKYIENPPEVTWVETPKDIFLKAKEDKNVPIKINVPKDAPPGGHFLVLWVSTKPEGGQVAIVSRVGSLVFINVSGNAIYKAYISELKAPKFAWNFPVKFSYVIKNEGNTYITPKGDIEIKNIFGRLIADLPINPRELQVLPNTSKNFEQEWKANFALGIYKAIFNLEYANSRDSLTHWLIFIDLKALIIILLILIFAIFFLPRLIKKYNEWIIKKYTQNKNINE